MSRNVYRLAGLAVLTCVVVVGVCHVASQADADVGDSTRAIHEWSDGARSADWRPPIVERSRWMERASLVLATQPLRVFDSRQRRPSASGVGTEEKDQIHEC